MRVERLIKIKIQDTLNEVLSKFKGCRFHSYIGFKKKVDKYFPFGDIRKATNLRVGLWDFLAYKYWLILRKRGIVKLSLLTRFLYVLKKLKRRAVRRIIKMFVQDCEICGSRIRIFTRLCKDCNHLQNESAKSMKGRPSVYQ